MAYFNSLFLQPTATSTDLTTYGGVAAATTNATSLLVGAYKVFGGSITNSHATNWRYLKIYDKASAPTVGTDIPKLRWGIPPGGGRVMFAALGLHSFVNGIAIAITQGAADTDTTAVSATNELVWELYIA